MWRREEREWIRGIKREDGEGLSVFGEKGEDEIYGEIRWNKMKIKRKRIKNIRGKVDMIVVKKGEGEVNIG